MKNKDIHNVRTFLNSSIKIVERGKIDTRNTQIHDVTHKYMTTPFPRLLQAPEIKVAELN